ncbi:MULTISPECIES: GNAT family N-acetyltransferase [Microbacterium]|uniref:GNAT family N-acetyltransferase n=1 Tax=Microbacterium TaxID=33882 RepID=UPI00035C14F7|nr:MULTISPECIES: GNAT family N-acetyltransferase [unclassified Microbacterium]MDT3343961.1 GNAT family N-acetyltransferase [Microbacterium sp. KSW2-22]SDH08750.1 N-acetylglutamate synthase, GNAT family [Microbacterium sp. 77mftsu3.1]
MIDELDVPVTLASRNGSVRLRGASQDDLDAIVALLSDDPVSAGRGDVAAAEDRGLYLRGLLRTLDSESNDVLVVESDDRVVGTMQLTVIPGMARRGSTRLLVEAVRVASAERSAGIGAAMMTWVADVAAPAVGASVVQLTSDAARTDAHRFYTRLGFVDSHVGFKLAVPR